MPRTMFLFKQCIYGGAAGYCPRVQNVSTLLQRLQYIYTLYNSGCQPFYNKLLMILKQIRQSLRYTMPVGQDQNIRRLFLLLH